VPYQPKVQTHISANGVDRRVKPSVSSTYSPNPKNNAETTAGNIEYIALC
jgi:hypothetical protein